MSESNTGAPELGAGPDWPAAVPPPTAPLARRRAFKVQNALWGGMLAGLGLAVALLGVAHVVIEAIQQQYNGMSGTIFLVAIIAGPAFGLGLGIMTTALIPDDPAPSEPTVPVAAGPGPGPVVASPGS
jgi:hypothetical protein